MKEDLKNMRFENQIRSSYEKASKNHEMRSENYEIRKPNTINLIMGMVVKSPSSYSSFLKNEQNNFHLTVFPLKKTSVSPREKNPTLNKKTLSFNRKKSKKINRKTSSLNNNPLNNTKKL